MGINGIIAYSFCRLQHAILWPFLGLGFFVLRNRRHLIDWLYKQHELVKSNTFESQVLY